MAATMICLALAIFYEARGEPELGQIAVAQVILNRAEIRDMSACDVLVEKGQFSFKPEKYVKKVDTEHGRQTVFSIPQLPTQKKGWKKSMESAEKAVNRRDPMHQIEFFHAVYVAPPWEGRYLRVFRVGNHVFYSRKQTLFKG